MSPDARYIKSGVPAGRAGDWCVEKFVVAVAGPGDTRPTQFVSKAGTYTRLKMGNDIFMTDLYDEWWTQRRAIEEARKRGGDVLITGLGLGLVVESILAPPAVGVGHVVVVEQSADVIELVGPYLRERYAGRVQIVNASAFDWSPGARRFSVAWHDIWPNPHEPRVQREAPLLEQRYAPVCAWQGNWLRDYRRAEHSAGARSGA